MPYEQRDDSGSLFKNDRKTTDNHPDYTGSGMIDGTEYWISAWIKTAQTSGQKFMSLAFTPKQPRADQPGARTATNAPQSTPPGLNDDIPF